MAYYLTYRPQQINDLDNQTVREILYSVLSQEDPPHAYLFTGPKGLGKTSSARLVAKSLNCLTIHGGTRKEKKDSPKNVEPCNTCQMCVSITNGSSMDVLEIDAASNRGIDEIRELRERIRLAPAQARRKVYIIDEVHMLTNEAFNALLKTLEEPPKHAVFILATTEPHKVPETIISRCLHVPFSRATEDELVRSLKRIVKAEKLTVTDTLLKQVASLADGGFRDGTKILEELVSLSKDKHITEDLLEKRYHINSTHSAVFQILTAFGNKDTKSGFEIVSKLSENGTDFTYVLEQVIDGLHRILLEKTGVLQNKEKNSVVSLFSLSDLTGLFVILNKAANDMKYTIIPELPLEIALIEWSVKPERVNTEHVVKDEVIKEKVEELVEEVTVKSLRKQMGNVAKKQFVDPEPKKVEKVEKKDINVNLLAYKSEGDLTDEWIAEFWNAIIHRMKEYNHTLAGVMRGCKVRSFDRKTLIIETKFTFHKERLSDEKTLKALEEVCKSLTGNNIKVLVELSK